MNEKVLEPNRSILLWNHGSETNKKIDRKCPILLKMLWKMNKVNFIERLPRIGNVTKLYLTFLGWNRIYQSLWILHQEGGQEHHNGQNLWYILWIRWKTLLHLLMNPFILICIPATHFVCTVNFWENTYTRFITKYSDSFQNYSEFPNIRTEFLF